MTALDAALEYLDKGWAPLPINPQSKSPLITWGHYVDNMTMPTTAEVEGWWAEWPDAQVAIITGPLSGLVVVDCDTDDEGNLPSVDAAKAAGLTRTPIVARTKNGFHYYFKFPQDAGWIKNRVGKNVTRSHEWPAVAGFDLRGSKGYVLAPPSPGKSWAIMDGCDFDDMPIYPMPTFDTPTADNVISFNEMKFEGMSLTNVKRHVSVWASTAELVEQVGKLPSGGGNARDDRLWKAIAERAAEGYRGGDLVDEAYKFMAEFFVEYLDAAKVAQMCNRVEDMEAKNHPDRLKEEEPEEADEPRKFTPITTKDIPELEAQIGSVEYYIDPIIPTSGTIIQVHGFSGHGKSMFLRHMLYAAAAKQSRFGPFNIIKTPKVLYLDFENSKSNVAKFLARSKRSFGDAGDKFMIWAPFHDHEDMNLRTESGLKLFYQWVKANKPDIVVLDTVRSAWSGLMENSAEEWSNINRLMLKLRNAGLTVILVHHSNKPSDGSVSGREAGSSNQLTVLETQIKITQIFEDKDSADIKAGLWDGDLPNTPFATMSSPQHIDDAENMDVMMDVRFGKVREWSDTHEPFYHVGFVSNRDADTVRIMAQRTPQQRAQTFAQEWEDAKGITRPALSDAEIASRLHKQIAVVREWTQPIRAMSHASAIANAQ